LAFQLWVRQRGANIRSDYKIDLARLTPYKIFVVSPPGKPAWLEFSNVICLLYKDPKLYLFQYGQLPSLAQDYHESFVAPYVTQHGGNIYNEPPREFRGGIFDHITKFIPQLDSATPIRPETNTKITFDATLERTQVASEEVHVPRGVNIKVKRSRTIEHTIEIGMRHSGTDKVDVGSGQILTLSIQEEIEHSCGQSYQRSETIEYEIELSGDVTNSYALIWTEMWRRGFAEIQDGSHITKTPFRYRERAELEVKPL
jgi:hypothetical protein